MKTRSKLVSNSSSSSFVATVKAEPYAAALEKVHPYVKAVAEEVFYSRKRFGIPVMEAASMDVHGYRSWDELDLNYAGEVPKNQWDEDLDPSQAVDELLSLLSKKDYEVFSVND